jgi:predicted ATPase/DNA-binding CsgD family transcriptional regulator
MGWLRLGWVHAKMGGGMEAAGRKEGQTLHPHPAWSGVAARRALLVGRDPEVGQVLQRLESDGLRLLTVTGAGGVGKTAVVDEALRQFAARARVSVQAVALQGQVGRVAFAHAEAVLAGKVGAPQDQPGAPVGRRRVVFLDGAESAPRMNTTIGAALDADAGLVVVATSIRPLQLYGEQVVRLERLTLPRLGERDPDRALAAPAVRLFYERLRAANSAFTLTTANVSAVLELCRFLDGLPLALELAAARCATLGVERVLGMLREVPFAVLGHRPDRGGERRRSLRETIRCSYALLTERQQVLLGRCAVFSGGFDWDALIAIVPDNGDRPSPSGAGIDLADDLTTLVTVGLVDRHQVELSERDGRYSIPAAVRAFVGQLGATRDALGDLRMRHANYYRARARVAAAHQWTFGGHDLGHALRADQSELLAAYEVTQRESTLAATLEFAADLCSLWMSTGAAQIGADLLTSILDRAGMFSDEDSELPDQIVAAALVSLVTLTLWSRDPKLSQTQHAYLNHAYRLAARAGRADLGLAAQHARVQLHILERDADAAYTLATNAAATADRLDNGWWYMCFQEWAAIAANSAGNHCAAIDHAIVARNRAQVANDEHALLITTHVLASTPGAGNDPRTALPTPETLLDLARRLDDVRFEGMLLVRAAHNCARTGRLAEAGVHLAAAFDLAARTNYWYLEELALFVVVVVASRVGETQAAARLHGTLNRALPAIRSWLPPPSLTDYDAAVTSARSSLGKSAFDELVGEGEVLGWNSALRDAEELATRLAERDRPAEPVVLGLRPVPDTIRHLSGRELEVLRYLAAGYSNKEIAAALTIRPKTIMHHIANIYRKLGVHTRMQASHVALEAGILEAGSPVPARLNAGDRQPK